MTLRLIVAYLLYSPVPMLSNLSGELYKLSFFNKEREQEIQGETQY